MMAEATPPLGEIIVYETPDGELRVKDTERFLKDRGI